MKTNTNFFQNQQTRIKCHYVFTYILAVYRSANMLSSANMETVMLTHHGLSLKSSHSLP